MKRSGPEPPLPSACRRFGCGDGNISVGSPYREVSASQPPEPGLYPHLIGHTSLARQIFPCIIRYLTLTAPESRAKETTVVARKSPVMVASGRHRRGSQRLGQALAWLLLSLTMISCAI